MKRELIGYPKGQVKDRLAYLKEKMDAVGKLLSRAASEIGVLRDLQADWGDEIYFRALSESSEIRAGFAYFIIKAKSFRDGQSNWRNIDSMDGRNA